MRSQNSSVSCDEQVPRRREAQGTKNCLVAGENVAQAAKRSSGGLRKSHTARAAAGAVTDRFRLEDHHRLAGSKSREPSTSGKAGEAGTNDDEIRVSG